MTVNPTDRCNIDVLNESTYLNLTSPDYHMAVHGDKSVTAQGVKKVFKTGSPGKIDGSSSVLCNMTS